MQYPPLLIFFISSSINYYLQKFCHKFILYFFSHTLISSEWLSKFHFINEWASLVTQLVNNPPAMWETWVWSLGWEDPLKKGKATHSSILAWKLYSPWGHKDSDTTESLSLFIFPGGSEVNSVCLQCRKPRFDPWVRKIPWWRKWQPTPVFLPGGSHGRRSLVGYSPQDCKELDERGFVFLMSIWGGYRKLTPSLGISRTYEIHINGRNWSWVFHF